MVPMLNIQDKKCGVESDCTKVTSSISLSGSIAQVIPWISNRPSKYLLPHCCVYLAYTLCFLLAAFSIVIIILYGHEFGKALAVKWLLACFVSIVESIIIIEPLKVRTTFAGSYFNLERRI